MMAHRIPGKPIVDSNAMCDFENRVSEAWLGVYGAAVRLRAQNGRDLRLDFPKIAVSPIDTRLMLDALAKALGMQSWQISNTELGKLIAVILGDKLGNLRLEPRVWSDQNGKVIRFIQR